MAHLPARLSFLSIFALTLSHAIMVRKHYDLHNNGMQPQVNASLTIIFIADQKTHNSTHVATYYLFTIFCRSCHLSVRVSFSPFPFSVPSALSNVEGLCTTIVWSEPSQTNGILTGYDLRFYSNDRENIVSNRSDENFRIVKETDKPSGSENIFVQVRAYISYHKYYNMQVN